MDLMSTEHSAHNPHPGQTLDDAWRWDALETIQPESPPIDPDLAVQFEIDAYDLGFSRGMRFRLAEMRAELEALVETCGYTVSPCGIHLYPVPVRCCARCGA